MFYQLRIFGQCSINILFRWSIDVVVPLHTNTSDRYTGILHLLHHIVYSLALLGVCSVVVVIEQQSVGVCLMSIFKSFGNKFIATKFEQTTLAIGRRLLSRTEAHHVVVVHGFVDHIPCIYNVLISVDYCMDMFAQALVEHLFFHFLTFFIGKHPVGELAVPNQTMSAQFDTILSAEVGNTVCSPPVPYTFFWVYRYRFHIILGSHTVKFSLDQCDLFRLCNIVLIDSHTNSEIVFVGIFQTLCLSGCCADCSKSNPYNLLFDLHVFSLIVLG